MIILSLPYTQNGGFVEKLMYQGIDAIEYRLDYSERIDEIDFSQFSEHHILTLRDYSEGGKTQFSREKKGKIYNNIISSTKSLLDDEIQNQILDPIEIPPNRLILSWHANSAEESLQKIEEIIEKTNHLECKFLKIAVQIDHYDQLSAIENALQKSIHTILLTATGKLGKIVRLLYNHLGAAGTFIGIAGNETAEGQLTYHEMELFHLHQADRDTLIFGILGGCQVWQSLGLSHYNDKFRTIGINAMYLPFAIESTADFDTFMNWFTYHFLSYHIRGITITSPWKFLISEYLSAPLRIMNCYLPFRQRQNIAPWALNTDKDALINSLATLNITRGNRILLYGSGAMAELALSVMKDYDSLYIYGRNQDRIQELCSLYRCDAIDREFLLKNDWDVVINCTTIGMMGESFRLSAGNISFRAVIDLPYSENDTPLISFCKQQKIPYVSGKMFWEFQAAKQESVFLEEAGRLEVEV
ncbi:MAG TPA: type I 3-dehydroquinate dehydratase [Candidatus Cloacimonadota bacterium]|nr:type I 3-dehydroquinate dehydratase [Candidatus Cloacimonadota bacterium]HPT72573.1 type I 3-dehydroquinate dehydratase [Candidatus Cloacimonadota bacterium]